jgi:phosphoglycolate phosphatase
MITMLPRLVLLDWSGTISDDRGPVYEANMRLLEKYGETRLTMAEWRDGRDGWNAGNYLAKTRNLNIESLYAEFGVIFGQTKSEFGSPQPYPGAQEFLATLMRLHIPAEIISSHITEHIRAEVAHYGFDRLIRAVRGSVHDKASAIAKAVIDAEVDPVQTIYLGDTVQDIHAVRQIGRGIGIVAATYGYHSRELLQAQAPDLLTNSLKELTIWIESLPSKP